MRMSPLWKFTGQSDPHPGFLMERKKKKEPWRRQLLSQGFLTFSGPYIHSKGSCMKTKKIRFCALPIKTWCTAAVK
jgi:hypothetical protein